SQNAGSPAPRAGRAADAGDASAACGFCLRVCVAGLPPPIRCRQLHLLWGPRKRSAAPHSGGGGGPALAFVLTFVGTALPDASTHRAGGGEGQARAERHPFELRGIRPHNSKLQFSDIQTIELKLYLISILWLIWY
ncbi:Protein TIC 21 chloroplastic, partial [Zea mays]